MGGKEVRNDSNLVFDCFSEAVINLRKKVHSGSRFRREESAEAERQGSEWREEQAAEGSHL